MKILYTVTGTISLVLGVIGIFVPLLPTTPFLLLSAALYFRGSPRLYDWLLNQKYLGPYIRNFREYRAIPLRAKIVSVSLIWITISYCIFSVAPYLWLKIVLFGIAVGTSWHILSYKTLKKQKQELPNRKKNA
ncbi:YbaN family protein [Phocaeicola sp.]